MAANLEVVISAKDQASGVLSGIDKNASTLGKTLGTGLKLAAAGAAVGIAGLGGFLVTSVKEAMDSQKAIAQLEAVLASTGGAAGLTKEQLLDMAGGFQKITAFSDEAVMEVENLLLTFTNIGAPVFKEATGLALDMSTALGQDLKSSSIQLGKALNDPITGMTALRRVGVAFTEDQVKQITALQESGDLMDAQKMILAELSKEFGGSAAAAANTFGGRMAQLKNAFSEVQETVGMALLPILTSLAKFLAGQLPVAMAFAQEVIGHVSMAIRLLIAGFKEGDVTSSGWHGTMEEIGSTFREKVFPIIKSFGDFLKNTILPAIKDFVSQKSNLIAVGGAVAALFTVWAITAGIAAVATIAAAAPLYILIAAVAGTGAAIALLEAKTGFFSKTLVPALKDVAKWAGPILSEALVTLKQGWDNLKPAVMFVGGFLIDHVLPVFRSIGKFIVEHKPLLIGLAIAIGLLVAPFIVVTGAIILMLARWDEIKAMFTDTIPAAIDSMIKKIEEIPVIGDIFQVVMDLIQLYVETAFTVIKATIETAITAIGWSINNVLVPAFNAAAWVINNVVVPAFNTATGLISSTVVPVINSITDAINLYLIPAFNGVASVVSTVWGGIAGLIGGAVDSIIGFINVLIRGINSIPDINIDDPSGLTGGVHIGIPDIPEIPRGSTLPVGGIGVYEHGGVVPGPVGMPQLAVVHGGERYLGAGSELPGGNIAINIYATPSQSARDIALCVRDELRNLQRRGR